MALLHLAVSSFQWQSNAKVAQFGDFEIAENEHVAALQIAVHEQLLAVQIGEGFRQVRTNQAHLDWWERLKR